MASFKRRRAWASSEDPLASEELEFRRKHEQLLVVSYFGPRRESCKARACQIRTVPTIDASCLSARPGL
jgi:hypothetical protein